MSADKLTRAVHNAAHRAAARNQVVYKGTIVSLSPIGVELHGSSDIIDEDQDLALSSWVKFYHATTGLVLGDNVFLARIEDDWVLFDIDNDTQPRTAGGPATTIALGEVEISTAATDPAHPIAVSVTDPRFTDTSSRALAMALVFG